MTASSRINIERSENDNFISGIYCKQDVCIIILTRTPIHSYIAKTSVVSPSSNYFVLENSNIHLLKT